MGSHFDYDEEDAIRDLLLGHTVTKVGSEELMLDDGTLLRIHGNEGCGGCANGDYWVEELNDSPVNAIMNVEFDVEETDSESFTYRIFVLAQNERIKLLEVDGSDGNGYYGTGYWIQVERPTT